MASNDNDIDRLWAAIRELQSQVGSGGGDGGFTPPGGDSSGDKAPTTPGEWIGGAIAKSLPAGGPLQMMQQSGQGQGVNNQLMADSVFWCASRFVCASMSCGGSGWC